MKNPFARFFPAKPAPPIPDGLAEPLDLRRFSQDELNVALGEAWRAGLRRAPFVVAHDLATREVARFRREKNKASRKNSVRKPKEEAVQ